MAIEEKLIFMDLWDTVRTCNIKGTGNEQEAQLLAASSIMLSLLKGQIPVFSQTHGFDSAFVLAAAHIGSKESVYFRNLVKKGHIRFHLFNRPSFIEAFRAALDNKDFIFSAWPELASGEVGRKPILEYLSGGNPQGIPDQVLSRLETLRELDSVNKEAKHGGKAAKTVVTLSGNLRILINRGLTDDFLEPLMRRLESLNSDDRSLHYRAIESYKIPTIGLSDSVLFDHEERIKRQARQLIDLCYNHTLANSLGSHEIILTASESSIVNTFADVNLPRSNQCEIAGIRRRNELELVRVGWNDIDTFLEEIKELPYAKREIQAKAVKMLACHEPAGEISYELITRVPNALFHGLLWSIPTYFLSSLISSDPFLIWTNVLTMASTGLYTGSRKRMKLIKNFKEKRRTKKYDALLKGRWIE